MTTQQWMFAPPSEMTDREADAREGQRRREAAIERVEKGLGPDAIEKLVQRVGWIALRRATLTTDDLDYHLATAGAERPREGRVYGAVMRKAAARGFIAPTADYRLSSRAACHRRPKRVWRSLVYRELPH